jgi:hypothetical protein
MGSPESAHSRRVWPEFVSRKLSGIVFMLMELFSFDYQLVPNFSADDQKHDFIVTHIIQHAQFTDAKLKLGKGVARSFLIDLDS